MHVAEAAFETAARVDCRRPGGITHQVHSLCGALGRVGARQADACPEVIAECRGPVRAVGQFAHGLVEEGASRTCSRALARPTRSCVMCWVARGLVAR